MFERNIYDYYHLYCDSRFTIGEYEGFQAGGMSYLLLPKEECASNEQEMLKYAEYLRSIGDTSVLELQPTVYQSHVGLVDGQDVYVCALPVNDNRQAFRVNTDDEKGAHLAAIHYYGKQMPVHQKTFDYYGQWHNLWQKRLEQLEDWYQQVLAQGPQTIVDESFLFTYPYFMGLTENAIQYVVDANYDDRGKEQEKGTICHRRFTDQTWLTLSENGDIVKKPTEFVYDHSCRDIAEWIRSHRASQDWREILSFLEGYEQYEPLSTYGWRLTYARLLFPLHYFETIESYYRTQLPERKQFYGEQFMALLENEIENERFLEFFSERIRLPRTRGMTPSIDWI
ncbi:spore coat putative kinase YutH [Halalkalibacter urbisdiaboli]|uniref:spore coat putative kinase YutH n=1 Tax=Halalkalibacter urbisdiaboli TaxID=1960589 RepID=UPI000B437417|nr:spore coat protein YutH [Halalkalibacter urbisdiaboli]